MLKKSDCRLDLSAFERYPWRLRSPLKQTVGYYHIELIEALQELAKASDHTYGSQRMKVALGVMSYPVSRNKARKLMKEASVLMKRHKKFKVTTDSNHAKPLFDNILNRDFAL